MSTYNPRRSQMQINGVQATALIEVLQDNHDHTNPVLFTHQGDGSVVVSFDLVTVTIDPEGETEEN